MTYTTAFERSRWRCTKKHRCPAECKLVWQDLMRCVWNSFFHEVKELIEAVAEEVGEGVEVLLGSYQCEISYIFLLFLFFFWMTFSKIMFSPFASIRKNNFRGLWWFAGLKASNCILVEVWSRKAWELKAWKVATRSFWWFLCQRCTSTMKSRNRWRPFIHRSDAKCSPKKLGKKGQMVFLEDNLLLSEVPDARPFCKSGEQRPVLGWTRLESRRPW